MNHGGLGAALWQELVAGFPGNVEIARIAVRLLVAVVLGGILGFQRAEAGKAAGMRTYMLVTLGAALVVLLPQLTGMSSADLSRIIQGIVTGIGFIGGGVILKMSERASDRGSNDGCEHLAHGDRWHRRRDWTTKPGHRGNDSDLHHSHDSRSPRTLDDQQRLGGRNH